MSEGNFSGYLNELQTAYQALRGKGLDLFWYDTDTVELVMALPINDSRKQLPSGGLELTAQDVEFLRSHGYKETFISNVQSGNLSIRPYTKIEGLHHFCVETIERAARGERTNVHEIDLDLH